MVVFLDLNGCELATDDDDDLAEQFESLGAGKIGQTEFFDWVRRHVQFKAES